LALSSLILHAFFQNDGMKAITDAGHAPGRLWAFLALPSSLILLLTVGSRATAGPLAPAEIRHLGRTAAGWSVLETKNFRIFHRQNAAFAEKVAHIADRTRQSMIRKWFDTEAEAWDPRCELYLHATGADYGRDTGLPSGMPGYSTIRTDGGRVVRRRIDLNGGNDDLLDAVVPHEVTHIVLWSGFIGYTLPAWANEGMAVLTEPQDRIDRHLHELLRFGREGRLYTVAQLLEHQKYPEPRFLGPFYAQSISLVRFLTGVKGHQKFAAFLRDGLRHGYTDALEQHYGWTMADLEQHWRRHAFRPVTISAAGE
jgi:hypothetical protein